MIDEGRLTEPFTSPKKIREYVLQQIKKVEIGEV